MKISIVVVLTLLLAYLLLGLGSYGLLDNNEGLYAEIAREMLESRSFVIPQINGVPYLEKPPMLYWLMAASYSVFGQSEIAARLVPVLASLAVILALLWLGKKTGTGAGKLAALILGSSIGYVVMSRTLLFDMLLCAFLTWALCFLYLYFQEGKTSWLRWSHVFLGLAVLTKGLVAPALYYLIAATFLLVVRRSGIRGLLRSLFDPAALLVLFAVALPWHVLAELRDRDFAWFYFINEHALRFLHMRRPYDYYTGPWYYYLPRILLGLFPWSLFLPLLLVRSREHSGPDNATERFLWLWFLVPLAFFSLSQAKANYYMIVGAPPLAMLLATKIRQMAEENRVTLLAILTGVLLLASVIGLAALVPHAGDSKNLSYLFADGPRFLLFFGLFLGCVAVALLLLIAQRMPYALYALAFSGIPIIILFLSTAVRVEPEISSKQVAEYLRTASGGHTVFLYKDFEDVSALMFYFKRPISLIDSDSSDLQFGSSRSAHSGRFISGDQFVRLGQRHEVFVVVMEKRLNEFHWIASAASLLAVRHIGRTVVFSNHEHHALSRPPVPS
jgi:4-amino-4-deoxy-L-arabinose transferase-like glycosyltransferase